MYMIRQIYLSDMFVGIVREPGPYVLPEIRYSCDGNTIIAIIL